MRDDEIGSRQADELVKVWLMDGSQTWIDVLQIRFGELPNELVDKINQTEDLTQLKMLLNRAVTTNSLSEFQQAIAHLKSADGETAEVSIPWRGIGK